MAVCANCEKRARIGLLQAFQIPSCIVCRWASAPSIVVTGYTHILLRTGTLTTHYKSNFYRVKAKICLCLKIILLRCVENGVKTPRILYLSTK